MARPIVLIEWTDSATSHGWSDHLPSSEDMACRSVGFLVAEDEHAITLAFGIGATEHLCAQMIPKQMIRSRVVLDG